MSLTFVSFLDETGYVIFDLTYGNLLTLTLGLLLFGETDYATSIFTYGNQAIWPWPFDLDLRVVFIW